MDGELKPFRSLDGVNRLIEVRKSDDAKPIGNFFDITAYDSTNPDHTKIVPLKCKICGKSFMDEAFYQSVGGICPECEARQKREDEAARLGNITTPEMRFDAIAPRSFFEGPTATNINRKGFPREAYETAIQWTPNYEGLLIYGETGACKSRILFALIRKLIVRDRVDVEVLNGGDFRQRMMEAYIAERTERVLNRMKKVAVLAWDDFGQDALKPGMETDLRSVIDYRYRDGLPIIITTQFTTAKLTQRLAGGDESREQVCASIIRRINERSRIIKI